MNRIVQRGSSFASGPTLPFANPHYNTTFGSFDLVSSPVWWKTETNNLYVDKINIFASHFLVEPSGIRSGRASNINGRLESKRPSVPAGPPLNGQAALLSPHGPVEAIIRHPRCLGTCPRRLIGSHCTKWADDQHRPARFESRLGSDLLLIRPLL